MFKQFYSDIDELHKLVTSEMRLKVAINHSHDAWAEVAEVIRKFAQATAEAYPSTIFLASLFSERIDTS